MLILTFCPGSTATALLFRKYSSAKIQPDFRNKKLEEKNEKPKALGKCVCAFAGLCDVGLDDALSKASITYRTVLPAACRGRCREQRVKGCSPTGRSHARKEGTEVTPLNQVSTPDPLSISDTRTELRQVFWTQGAELLSFCDSDITVPVQ